MAFLTGGQDAIAEYLEGITYIDTSPGTIGRIEDRNDKINDRVISWASISTIKRHTVRQAKNRLTVIDN